MSCPTNPPLIPELRSSNLPNETDPCRIHPQGAAQHPPLLPPGANLNSGITVCFPSLSHTVIRPPRHGWQPLCVSNCHAYDAPQYTSRLADWKASWNNYPESIVLIQTKEAQCVCLHWFRTKSEGGLHLQPFWNNTSTTVHPQKN